MSFIPNEISRITSHAHSSIPDTSEILMNVQLSYEHSWLYLVCYNHECFKLIYIFIKMSKKMSIIKYNTAARVINIIIVIVDYLLLHGNWNIVIL